MDSLTHLLVGGSLAQAGVRKRWPSVALLAAASLAPDAEQILRPFSASLYARMYHGPLHSLLGVIGLAAILALLYSRLFEPSVPGISPSAMVLALAGCGSHLFLDIFQGYGPQLLWPFTTRRYGLPLMAQYDLAVLALVGLAIVGPALLSAVNREVGAKPVNNAPAARIALLLVVALLPARAVFRSRAYAAAHGAPLTEGPESVAVFPSALVPWHWNAVEDTSIAYLVYEMDGWGGERLPYLVRLPKPLRNNLLVAARDTPAGRAFLDLAFYPFYSLEEGRRAGVQVRIRDLAFYTPGGSNRPYSMEIEITSTMKILSEQAVF